MLRILPNRLSSVRCLRNEEHIGLTVDDSRDAFAEKRVIVDT
jgi:hypothetical protein